MEDEKNNPRSEDGENPASEADSKSSISADLIRGHINTIILRTLYERDKYGYEIIEEIEAKSHGQYSLKQPTLYSALKRLESQGFINAYWRTDEVSQGGRRKYYTLTDSGREVTERNQAEWEYSRTVIDNLISDRNFDFSQPAPTAVDFKILKSSTSRIRTVKADDEDDEGEVQYEEPANEQVVKVQHEDATRVVVTEEDNKSFERAEPTTQAATEQLPLTPPPVDPQQQYIIEQQALHIQQLEQTIQLQELQKAQQAQRIELLEKAQEDKAAEQRQAEERKALHENYVKLISEPAQEKEETPQTPYADSVDTEKLIYNNKPETERDYKNLVNDLFANTIKREYAPPVPPAPAAIPMAAAPVVPPQAAQQPIAQPIQAAYAPQPERQPDPAELNSMRVESVKIDEATQKANEDGLTIGTTDYPIGTRKKRYNLGSTLFKSSIIVGIIMLLEFALCLIFKDELGVTLAYPFVILALACAQVLIFGVLYCTDAGKSTRKPTTFNYLSACIIVTIAAVLVIFIVSILLKVNFGIVGDVMAKIVIPCIVALNISVFGTLFYLFSR